MALGVECDRVKIRTIGVTAAVSALVVAAGCTVEQVRRPPVTIEQYEQARAQPDPYPARTIVQHNLQRAMDPDLGESERVQSMRLIAHLGEGDPAADEQLAGLLESADASEPLKKAALELLLKRGRGDLAGHVASTVPKIGPGSEMKGDVLTWLERHPDPKALADVIRLWAAEPSATTPDEPRYRSVVAAQSPGSDWRGELLAQVNRPDSPVQGEALSVLAARTQPGDLAARVRATAARSEAMAAMQAFVAHFGSLPRTPGELGRCRQLYAAQGALFGEAGKLCSRWRTEDGYRFNVRDFHVISRLAQDPFRRGLRRPGLVREITAALTVRRHIAHHQAGRTGTYGFSDRFLRHVDSLSMADLWTIRLLSEMLSVPQVRAKTATLVTHDQADRRSALGGLVLLERNGRPRPRVYPPDRSRGDDLAYHYTAEGLQDAADCLCRFQAHFERTDNAGRAGPTAEELSAAAAGNYRGLILTSLSGEDFCAHAYTPEGITVSLGVFSYE